MSVKDKLALISDKTMNYVNVSECTKIANIGKAKAPMAEGWVEEPMD
jgi:hypothetical protein